MRGRTKYSKIKMIKIGRTEQKKNEQIALKTYEWVFYKKIKINLKNKYKKCLYLIIDKFLQKKKHVVDDIQGSISINYFLTILKLAYTVISMLKYCEISSTIFNDSKSSFSVNFSRT